MSTFILVHGGWYAAWCWKRVVPRLQHAGHRAVAVDLPGHGEDRTPVEKLTLQAYADTVLAAIDSANEPVVLVGWSNAGIAISTAAEQQPDRIAGLVYLAAFMLPSGVSVLEFRDNTPEFYETSKDPGYLVVEPDKGILRVAPGGARALFLNDADDVDVAWVSERLQNNFIAPNATPVQVSDERWGSIRRTYIETLYDQTIPLAAQRKMQELSPGATVHSVATGHSPLITSPDETAYLLLTAADRASERNDDDLSQPA